MTRCRPAPGQGLTALWLLLLLACPAAVPRAAGAANFRCSLDATTYCDLLMELEVGAVDQYTASQNTHMLAAGGDVYVMLRSGEMLRCEQEAPGSCVTFNTLGFGDPGPMVLLDSGRFLATRNNRMARSAAAAPRRMRRSARLTWSRLLPAAAQPRSPPPQMVCSTTMPDSCTVFNTCGSSTTYKSLLVTNNAIYAGAQRPRATVRPACLGMQACMPACLPVPHETPSRDRCVRAAASMHFPTWLPASQACVRPLRACAPASRAARPVIGRAVEVRHGQGRLLHGARGTRSQRRQLQPVARAGRPCATRADARRGRLCHQRARNGERRALGWAAQRHRLAVRMPLGGAPDAERGNACPARSCHTCVTWLCLYGRHRCDPNKPDNCRTWDTAGSEVQSLLLADGALFVGLGSGTMWK